jgi:hypothetical protein
VRSLSEPEECGVRIRTPWIFDDQAPEISGGLVRLHGKAPTKPQTTLKVDPGRIVSLDLPPLNQHVSGLIGATRRYELLDLIELRLASNGDREGDERHCQKQRAIDVVSHANSARAMRARSHSSTK